MSSKKMLCAACLILAGWVLISGAIGFRAADAENAPSMVPSFAMVAATGHAFSTASLAGTRYLLVFASGSCRFCAEELPPLLEMAAARSVGKRIFVLWSGAVEPFPSGAEDPHWILSWDRAILDLLQIEHVPALLLVDEAGRIIARRTGRSTPDVHRRLIDLLARGS